MCKILNVLIKAFFNIKQLVTRICDLIIHQKFLMLYLKSYKEDYVSCQCNLMRFCDINIILLYYTELKGVC